jgi:hypothetical protein
MHTIVTVVLIVLHWVGLERPPARELQVRQIHGCVPPSPGLDVAPLPPHWTNKAPVHAHVPVTKGLDAEVELAGAVSLAAENELDLAGRIVVALLQVSNVGIPYVPGGLAPLAAPSPSLSAPSED